MRPPGTLRVGSHPKVSARLRSRRTAAIAVTAAVLLFTSLLAILPAFTIGFDEAKYLGVGANVWAGHGPLTAFGYLFLLHSPVWMTVLYAPQALFGIDAVGWGHLLNAIAGLGVVALTAVMGWRIRPAVGVVAVFAMLGFNYLFDLTRTTRLDVPAAALALLYLEMGWRAVRTGSRRWAAGAGIVFALAVLVKEVAIPLAPVPFLCGILVGAPWRQLLRTAAWTTLLAAIGLAPWFLYYAAQTGRVYRVESPAWTLAVVFAGALLVVLGGLVAERIADRPGLNARMVRIGERLPARARTHGRAILGWTLTILWSAAFLYFFSRISRLKGAPLVQPTQMGLYLRTWLIDLAPVTAFVVVGFVLALVMLAWDRGARGRSGMINVLVATICGVPLVLMVVAVGEPPRNYIAQVSTAIVLAAGAWTWAIALGVSRLTRAGARPRLARWGLPIVVGLAICLGTASLGARAWVTRAGSGESADAAVRTTVQWIRANVPKGTPIAFGSFLSYEMAYSLVADYPTYQVRHRIATVEPTMPVGFRRAGEPPADDWVAADTAPRNVNEFQAFRAAWVEDLVRRWNIGYWVYSTGIETSAPTIRAQLTPEHGFDAVASWDVPARDHVNNVTIYRVNLDRLGLDRAHLYISPEALTRLVDSLERDPEASRAAAAALLPRIVVEPPSSAAAADLARLGDLAAP
jgi:4-amino-4-deoxy-L-arabinose transferase-like glycosyltransferase